MANAWRSEKTPVIPIEDLMPGQPIAPEQQQSMKEQKAIFQQIDAAAKQAARERQ